MIGVILLLATTTAYWGVWNHEFLNLDDNEYITQNPRVQAGLSWGGVAWAFTTDHAGNWHPLTWLSHMLDQQMFGGGPFGPHLVNLLLHLASTWLLFRFLVRTTGSTGRSAFVAAVFALHPLHVESVAWAAERKDVLSTLFWMLAMTVYARTARPGAALIVLYALGLLAKPMLVTLPFVLLLLDLWPLRRLDSPWDLAAWGRLAREKAPLFALALASSATTWIVQHGRGAMNFGEQVAIGLRIQNALVSYVAYLVDAVWPAKLGVFYPHPGTSYPAWEVAGAALILAFVTFGALLVARRRPVLAVGWLWYVGTLVPVIGIMQVGAQARADRYTYIPLVGVSIAVAWGLGEIAERWRGLRNALVVAGVLAAGSWTYLTRSQVSWWKNDQTLFEREVQLVPGHYVARGILGNIRLRAGRLDEAIEQYRIALSIRPGYGQGHSNYGMALELQGKKAEAFEQYQMAVRCEPSLVEPHHNLARLLAEQGKRKEAIEHYETALAYNPDFAESHVNLGVLLAESGRIDEGTRHLERALELKPGLDAARRALDAVRAMPNSGPRGP
jgi:Tfp pilus assembly protein PilF